MVVLEPIVILGGTFDPIHNGHISLAKEALRHFKVSKVLFLLTKNPKGKSPTEANDRLNMLKLALKDYPEFEISTIELESNKEFTYTLDTLIELKKIYSNREIIFLIGADCVNDFEKWHEPYKVSQLAHLVCFKRPGYKINKEIYQKYGIELVESNEVDADSTSIRLGKSLETPKEVIDYIVKNNLYFIPKVKEFYKEKRYIHALSVANVAYDIAKANGLDAPKAYLAGLYHDIAKKLSDEECKKWMEGMYDEYLNYPSYTLHQFAGAAIAYKEFNIRDREILDAILHHTTGAPKMGKYDKIIYASDKIEPTRGYDSSEMINMMLNDVDKGFAYVLKENKKFIDAKGHLGEQTKLTDECYNNYILEKENK